MNKATKSMLMQVAAGAVILAGSVLPAFAAELNVGVSGSASVDSDHVLAGQTTTVDAGDDNGGRVISFTSGTQIDLRGEARMSLRDKAKDRADKEIDRRIEALTALSDRLNNAARLSSDEKASLSAELQAQIATMTNLKSKISDDADTESTTTLRTDIKSITDMHRVFALVMPQAAIQAAADRALTIVNTLTDLQTKLQARVTAAQTAGNDVSATTALFTDMSAKLADAKTQVNAAVSETASLTPDNGDNAKFQANLMALKDARTKIQAAQKDLQAARDDAKNIVKALGGFKMNATTTVSSSASASSD